MPERTDQNQSLTQTINHASVDRSLFSFAVGQIMVVVQRTPRRTARDKLRELMPPACQSDIDWLLERGHFTQRDLYWACKQQGLVAPDGVLRQSRIAMVDCMWSLTAAFFAGLWLLACLLLLAGGSPSVLLALQLLAMKVVLAGAMCASLEFGVWPHVTARKAVRALASKSGPEGLGVEGRLT